jgi:hypothetical protein
MKKTLLYSATITALFVLLSFVMPTVKFDVVLDPEPVATSPWQQDFVKKVQEADTDRDREKILQEEGKKLSLYLATFVRKSGNLCDITNMELVYASGKAKDLSSGDGKSYTGQFNNQVYARIDGESCFGDEVQVFARCTNMTVFEIIPDKQELTVNSSPDLIIRITDSQKLEDLVDPQMTVDIAELFSLPIYFSGLVSTTKMHVM